MRPLSPSVGVTSKGVNVALLTIGFQLKVGSHLGITVLWHMLFKKLRLSLARENWSLLCANVLYGVQRTGESDLLSHFLAI